MLLALLFEFLDSILQLHRIPAQSRDAFGHCFSEVLEPVFQPNRAQLQIPEFLHAELTQKHGFFAIFLKLMQLRFQPLSVHRVRIVFGIVQLSDPFVRYEVITVTVQQETVAFRTRFLSANEVTSTDRSPEFIDSTHGAAIILYI